MRTTALFDFDGTITRHDTFIRFGRFARGNYMFLLKLLASAPWLMLWKMGIIRNSQAKQTLFSFLFKGINKKGFACLCARFACEIDKDLRQDTIAILKSHQAQGHRVAIVSASIGDWIRPWAKANGVDVVIATEVEIGEDGCLTGRFATPNCHGAEKTVRILATMPDIIGEQIYAYGDSAGDDAMLALATHPHRISRHQH